ncbi:MAG: S-layer homology domain-containing protein [Nitriliruptoraceae bacterium]
MRFRMMRLASAVLAVTLTVSTVQLAQPAAAETPQINAQAAAFLLTQLVDGERIETRFGEMSFPDAGLTADVIFASFQADVAADKTEPALTWLAAQTDAYTGVTSGDTYAGAVAKLLLVGEASGSDTLFGTDTLIGRLLDRHQTSGRFTDASSFGDFSNTITQSLAIIALSRSAPEQLPATAATYLAGQACTDGGFPSAFDTEVCTSNVDATGFAVQALRAAGNTAAVNAAVAWLTQELDAERITNANAAGLAASAFAATGSSDALARTQTIITGLQAGCAANMPGAIRFSATDVGDATRATAQALFGRLGGDLATVTAPTSGVVPVALSCPPRFSDLDYDASVHAANIVALQQADTLAGFGDGTFRPRAAITRGQFASLLVTATGTAEMTETTPFSDLVDDTHAAALGTLYARGVISGFRDGTVRGSAPITRAQAAAIVSRFIASGTAAPAAYSDIADTLFAKAIIDVTERGLFQGINGQFVPDGPLRRDQAASVIVNVVALP